MATGKLRVRISPFWIRKFAPEQRKVAEAFISELRETDRDGAVVTYSANTEGLKVKGYFDSGGSFTASGAADRGGLGKSPQKAICQYVWNNWSELAETYGDTGTGGSGSASGSGNTGDAETGDSDGEGSGEGAAGSGDGETGDGSADAETGDGDGEAESQPPPMPAFPPSSEHVDTPATFLEYVRKLRAYCAEQAEDDEALDEIGNRPAKAGIRMGNFGIPYMAALDAMTQHWPEEAREENGIKTYDPASLGAAPTGHHKAFEYVKRLALARVPIYLWGPPGTGKSYLAEQLAEHFSLPYGDVSLTAGVMPSHLLGQQTIKGYREASFIRIYDATREGGVFALEEIDAASPNILTVINKALEQDGFDNMASGEHVTKSGQFVPVGCANTLGLGATRFHTGRERLDFATIDRFRMGRVKIELDETLEEFIVREEFIRNPSEYQQGDGEGINGMH